MRREARILLLTLLVGALWAGRTPALALLDDMELFRVTDVQVHGSRYLERAEIVALLGLTPESSIWGDVEAWTAAVRAHPMVRDARVTRRIPGRLVIAVEERVPVGLVAMATFEPVDGEGARLPLDPARHRLDLPVLATAGDPPADSRVVPAPVAALAREVARLAGSDTSFLRSASEVAWVDATSLSVQWSEPDVELLLRAGSPADRLREGLTALEDAMHRAPRRRPVTIDLRYADQVVVRTQR